MDDTHYLKIGIEPLEVIARAKLSFIEGSLVKYILRYKYKDGKKDLIKARFYLNKLISEYNHGRTSNK